MAKQIIYILVYFASTSLLSATKALVALSNGILWLRNSFCSGHVWRVAQLSLLVLEVRIIHSVWARIELSAIVPYHCVVGSIRCIEA